MRSAHRGSGIKLDPVYKNGVEEATMMDWCKEKLGMAFQSLFRL